MNSGCFAYMYISAAFMYLMPAEVRRWCWTLRNWVRGGYKGPPHGCWELKLVLGKNQLSVLWLAESSLLFPFFFLLILPFSSLQCLSSLPPSRTRQWAASTGKGTCHQAWWPDIKPQDPGGGRNWLLPVTFWSPHICCGVNVLPPYTHK